MLKSLGVLWRHHRPALIGFCLALVMMFYFLGRTVFSGFYWADPTHRDQPVQAWMTPRYIAHSWNVPVDTILEANGLTRGQFDHPTSLAEISRLTGIPEETLIAQTKAAIAQHRGAAHD